MRLLLSEAVPLRTTRMLGNFSDDAVLAHRYGDLTSGRFTLARLDDSTFFVADHPMRVADVFIDDQQTKGWDQALRSDAAGHTWTVIRLAAPAPNEARLSATGTGKRNPVTGALIENPADIIEDVLRLAGRADAWFDELRAEAGEAGIRLAGSLDDATLTLRAAIDEICGSCAAIWAPGMARLYPVLAPSGYVKQLDKMRVSNVVVTATLENTADVLRLAYDPDTAGSRSQHYVELTANPKRYGGVVLEQAAKWLRTPANAESVARRRLPWLAGERYDVAFDCSDASVRAGQWVKLLDHPQWPFEGDDPVVMVLSVNAEPGARSVACVGQTVVSAPAAIVTGHSVAVPVTRDAAVEVAVQNGVVTFTVTDQSGTPIAGARVGLDGSAAKRTDELGQVQFTASPGEHKLAVEAPGKVANVLTITL